MLKTIKMIILILSIIVVSTVLFFNLNPAFGQKYKGLRQERVEKSPNYKGGKFQNLVETPIQAEGFKFRDVMWEFMFKGKGRKPEKPTETIKFDREEFNKTDSGISITWFGHSTALIRIDGYTILADPVFSNRTSPVSFAGTKSFDFTETYSFEDLPGIDAIIISHDHYDHLDKEKLAVVSKEDTIVVGPSSVIRQLGRGELISIGQTKEFLGVIVNIVHSYNLNKQYHQKGKGVGYVITIDGTKVYHAGDTDFIPEMQKLTGYKQQGKEFIALLPVGGRFTMTAEEAAEAAKTIKPTLAIPMHYGSIIGSEEDANEFKELCEENNIKVEILEKG